MSISSEAKHKSTKIPRNLTPHFRNFYIQAFCSLSERLYRRTDICYYRKASPLLKRTDIKLQSFRIVEPCRLYHITYSFLRILTCVFYLYFL